MVDNINNESRDNLENLGRHRHTCELRGITINTYYQQQLVCTRACPRVCVCVWVWVGVGVGACLV